MTYRLLALLHVACVIVFVGNFVAAWLVWARARAIREPAVLRQLWGLVHLGDRWLTPVPVIGIMASGILMARMRELSVTGTGWILWSLVALAVSGIVFVARLAGLQRELATERDPFDAVASRRRLVSWGWWAAAGTAAVGVAIVLMVLQPALRGF